MSPALLDENAGPTLQFTRFLSRPVIAPFVLTLQRQRLPPADMVHVPFASPPYAQMTAPLLGENVSRLVLLNGPIGDLQGLLVTTLILPARPLLLQPQRNGRGMAAIYLL